MLFEPQGEPQGLTRLPPPHLQFWPPNLLQHHSQPSKCLVSSASSLNISCFSRGLSCGRWTSAFVCQGEWALRSSDHHSCLSSFKVMPSNTTFLLPILLQSSTVLFRSQAWKPSSASISLPSPFLPSFLGIQTLWTLSI